MAFAITSAMRLPDSGRTTRRNVIEDSADAFPCSLCARNEVRNMRATAKQRSCGRTGMTNICAFVLPIVKQ